MDVQFSEEQHALAAMARELFAAANPTTRVRELYVSDEPRDRKVWKQLAEVGITGIGVGGDHGGMEGGPADLAMVLEAAGAHLLPEPLTATVAVAAPVLAAAGGELATTWLPRIAAGDATATLAIGPAGGLDVPTVRDVDDADLVLVEREGTLWLDGPAGDAESVRAEDGSRRRFRRPALRGELLGGADLLELARLRMLAATSLELVGVGDALVQQCVEYARVRKQFETPIGAFQAIQHTLASMFVAVESARGAGRHAALALAGLDDQANGSDLDRIAHAVHVAAAAACRMHRQVNTDALQVFGGIGFTWEHDLHLWLKRGLGLEADLGGERLHRTWLADRLLA